MILLLTQTASNFCINHWIMNVCTLILNWLCCMNLSCNMYSLWLIVSISDSAIWNCCCLILAICDMMIALLLAKHFILPLIIFFISFLFFSYFLLLVSFYDFTSRLQNQAFSFIEQIVQREFWFLICSNEVVVFWLCKQWGKTDSTIRWIINNILEALYHAVQSGIIG